MANQIVVSAGAKVRNLDGVLTGTSGVVNSLPINASNGIPQLDVNGKILVSQLPNSVMEYQGTWNAATNTPTLANGTGNQGDVYLCNVAGTVDFGAGPIAFVVGDQVIYSGSIWQRASGATGTVTSVAITESGDSLNITGSPITTSGTINIGFNGTNLQYVNGAGNLTTFPDLTGFVPYTGATSNVNLGVYDLTSRLIKIDGSTNGGSLNIKQNATTIVSGIGYNSISAKSDTSLQLYYGNATTSTFKAVLLNVNNIIDGSTRAFEFPDANGTIALTSDIPSLTGYVPYTGATANVDLGVYDLTADLITGARGSFASNGGSDTFAINHSSGGGIALNITKGGSGEGLYINKTSGSGNAATIVGTLEATTLVKSGGTSSQFLKADGTVDSNTYALDSLVVKLAGTQTITGSKTFSSTALFDTTTLYKKIGSPYITSAGYTSLQFTASGTNTSLYITDGDSVTSNRLIFKNNAGYDYTFPAASGTIALTSDLTGGTVTSVAALTIGTTGTDLSSTVANSTTTPVITLNVPTASATNRGALSSADWTTFNNKQSALTNPVTGTGTTNYLPKFTGASIIGNSLLIDQGSYVESTANMVISNASTYRGLSITTTTASARPTLSFVNTNYAQYGSYIQDINGRMDFGRMNYDFGGHTRLMTLDASGNLGLGVTPSAWATYPAMQILRASFWGAVDNAYIGANYYFDGSTRRYINSNFANELAQESGEFRFYTAPSGTAGAAITFTQAMTLDASGNLGIGATTINYPLHIYKTSNARIGIQGTTNFAAIQYLNTGGSFYMGIDDSLGANFTGEAYGRFLYSSNAYPMSFFTNGAERMRITSAGRLLLGTTTESTYLLDVNGTGRFSGALSGTSATFSGSVIVGTTALLNFGPTTTFVGMSGNNSTGTLALYANNTQVLGFATSTGAATFSSSVTATSAIFGSSITSVATLHVNNTSSADPTSLSSVPTTNVFGMSTSPGGMLAAGIGTTGGTHVWLQGRNVGGAGVSYPISLQPLGGNVGIGTTSPSAKLVVSNGNALGYEIDPASTSGTVVSLFSYDRSAAAWRTTRYSSLEHIFESNGTTERMRITSGGQVGINTSSFDFGEKLGLYSTTSYTLHSKRSGTGSEGHVAFSNANGGVGSIFTNGSATSYNTSSDYRLKEDLKEINGLDKISAIKVYDFKWKVSDDRTDGVLAHELQEVLPYAVTGKKDGEEMQGVDYSKIVPILIKSIQELKQEIETLKIK